MRIGRTLRARIGLWLLVVFVLYQTVSSIRETGIVVPEDFGSGRFSVYQTRFNCLKDTLRYHPVAGYTDDGGWFQAQYALAPTILTQGFEQEVVVANFSHDSSENRSRAETQLHLLYDCRNGVRLYRGTTGR